MKMIKSNQPTNYNVLILLKRITACILVVTMLTALIPGNFCGSKSAYAAENVQYGQNDTYREIKHEGYETSFSINGTWWSGYNVSAIIRNTTAMTIDNWTVFLQFDGTITNIWDAVIKEHDSSNNTYILTNAGYNEDILPYSTVQFGFTVNAVENSSNRYPLPTECAMLQKEEELQCEEYSVRWTFSDPYNGILFIKNTSDVDICDWSLAFDTDIKLTGFYTAETLSTDGNHISIKNRGYNSDIRQGEEMALGFGCYYVDGSTALNADLFRNFALTDVRGLVGAPVVTPEPTEEPTVTPEPTIIVTPEPTEEPTVTPEPTIIVTPEPTEEPTVTPEPTIIITPEPTEEPTVTPEPTIIVTPEPTEEPTVTPEPTIIVTPEPTEDPTVTPEPTIIVTPEPTEEPTVTPEPTIIVTPKPTEEPTVTPEPTATPNPYEDLDPDGDPDGDHLSTKYEINIGTDPLMSDTDGDLIPDYLEIIYGSDPLEFNELQDGDTDLDSDGLTENEEIYTYGTDPLSSDTDGDGLKDGFEVRNGFNPLVQDTDDDGIPDGEEQFEQTWTNELSDISGMYNYQVSMAGKSIEAFGEETEVPLNIGAIRNITITTSIAGDIYEDIRVENLYAVDVMFTYIGGRVGVPVDINSTREFDEAVLTFEYDEEQLYCDEESLCIVWLNNDNEFVFLDSELDCENNKISCKTSHFSRYGIISRSEWNNYWDGILRSHSYTTTSDENKSIDIEIVLDAGNDYVKSNMNFIKSSLLRFNEAKFGSDRIGLTYVYSFRNEFYGDESEESYKDGKLYTSHTVTYPLSTSRSGIDDYLSNHIMKADSNASLADELEAILDFFENQEDVKEKKHVIWITTTSCFANGSAEVEHLLQKIYDEEIVIHQIHYGTFISGIEDEILNNIKATGGEVTVVTDASWFGEKLEGIINEINKNANSTDAVILFNSGAGPIKNDEVWDQVTEGIRQKLYSFKSNMRVGFVDAYRMLSQDQPDDPEGTYEISEWSQSSRWGSLSENQKYFADSVDNLVGYEKSASSEYTFETAYEYFLSSLNVSSNDKVVIIISSNPFVDSEIINKMADAGIHLYYILINEAPLSSSDRIAITNLIQKTGGNLYDVMPENKEYQKTEVKNNFTDAISRAIAYSMGRTDTLDSDGDGLFDCRELNGVALPNGSFVRLNPHSQDNGYGMFDEDKDTISDLWELGYRNGENDNTCWNTSNGLDGTIRVKGFKYRTKAVNIGQQVNEVFFCPLEETRNNVFVMYVNAKSNPLKIDSDGDGYDDFEELNHYFTNPLKSDVVKINLEDYISINTDGIDTYRERYNDLTNCTEIVKISLSEFNENYGGNQSWFSDPKINNDSVSYRLTKGGCGLIAASDFLIYLDKCFNTRYSGITVEDEIGFNEYDEYIRELGEYITPRNTTQIVFNISQVFFMEKLSEDIAEKLTGGSGTWGISPDKIVNGLDEYLEDKDKKLDKDLLIYKYPYVPQYYIEEKIIESLNNNIPVIHLITGPVKFLRKTGIEYETKLHFVTVTGIKKDDITGKTTLKCASWSEVIYIDLEESLNSSVMLSYMLGIKDNFNPKDDSSLDEIFERSLGIYHCIMCYE